MTGSFAREAFRVRAGDRFLFLCAGAIPVTLAILWVAYGADMTSALPAVPAWVAVVAILGAIGLLLWRSHAIQGDPALPWFLRKRDPTRRNWRRMLLGGAGSVVMTMLLHWLGTWLHQNDDPATRCIALVLFVSVAASFFAMDRRLAAFLECRLDGTPQEKTAR